MDPRKPDETRIRTYVIRNRAYIYFFFLLMNLFNAFFFIIIFLLARGPDITMEIEWPEGFTPPPDHVVRAILLSDDEDDGSD